VTAYWFLADRVETAHWLSAKERSLVLTAVREDRVSHQRKGQALHASFGAAARDPRVYLLGIVFFATVFAIYGFNYWGPSIIHGFGITSVLWIGLLSAIPYGAASVTMVLLGRHSDRVGDRRWHFVGAAVIGAAGFALAPLAAGHPLLGIGILSIAAAGAYGCVPVFWPIPQGYFSPQSAAGGLALINSIGVTGGMVGPYVLGELRTVTGDFSAGLYLISGVLIGACVLFTIARPRAPLGPPG
jgi:MFS family permease